ncbi:MAG: hypothetical protein J6S85_15855 [Methanobrevibacter sp.]|nr:hypothetical protein [Methanobrevibacter sp.]
MGIRDMFDHKYPITNLHEIDLTFLHDDINKMIATLEEWETVIDELKEAAEKYEEFAERLNVAEAEISSLKNTVVTLQGEIDAIEGTYGKDIADLKNAMSILESKMTILETKIAAVYNYIDNSINVLAKQMYKQDLIIMNKLNQAKADLQRQINDLYAIVASIRTDLSNPWHWGKVFSPDENNKLIYMDLADNCPSVEEYASLNLTADEYDAFNLTAYEYARNGKKMLHLDYVFSPIYGFKQSVDNVLTSILNWLEGTLSADAYTALNLTADEYTALNLSAADYYSYQ